MNRFIMIAMLLLLSSTAIYAQRLITGQKGFEATVGVILGQTLVHHNFYLQAGMTINTKNGNYQFYAAEYSRRTHEFEIYLIPVETMLAEGGYSLALFSDLGKNISLNLGISGVAGYEIINNSNNLLPNGAVIQAKDGLVYGVGGQLSFETYLGDHLVLLAHARVKALWGTSAEQFRPSAGVGLRYIF